MILWVSSSCGRIAREAKALVSSACYWASDHAGPTEILYQAIITHAVRCPDPFVQLRGRWIVRRLGPHCSRIEIVTMGEATPVLRLLHAMGWETANIHLGSPARKVILSNLSRQKAKWLNVATSDMLKAVRSDWETWNKDGYV